MQFYVDLFDDGRIVFEQRRGADDGGGVTCASSDEQQHLFDGLSANGGVAHMPLGDYGFGPFGWVQDRYGVNWQLAVSSSSAGDESR